MASLKQLMRQNHELRSAIIANLAEQGIYAHPDNRIWPVLYLAKHVLGLNESIELLVQRGLGREACILVRSMFEATVSVMWIALDPARRLQRYADYQTISARKYRDVQRRLGQAPTYSAAQAHEYDRLAEEAKRRHGFKSGENWSGKTVKKMAEEIGWLDRYEAGYRLYSEILHAGVSGAGEFITQNGKGVTFFNPSTKFRYDSLCIIEAYTYLAATFSFVDTLAELGMHELMDKAMADVKHLLDSQRD